MCTCENTYIENNCWTQKILYTCNRAFRNSKTTHFNGSAILSNSIQFWELYQNFTSVCGQASSKFFEFNIGILRTSANFSGIQRNSKDLDKTTRTLYIILSAKNLSWNFRICPTFFWAALASSQTWLILVKRLADKKWGMGPSYVLCALNGVQNWHAWGQCELHQLQIWKYSWVSLGFSSPLNHTDRWLQH